MQRVAYAHACRPPTAAEVLAGLRYASTSRTLWHLTAALSAKCLAATALIFWTPLVISDLISRGGWAEGASSAEHNRAAMLLTAVPYTLAAAASYAIGRSSHAWDDRKVHTCVLFTAGAAVLLAAPFLQVRKPHPYVRCGPSPSAAARAACRSPAIWLRWCTVKCGR